MKQKFLNTIIAAAVLLTVAPQTGCKKNFTDPTRATEDQVFSSPRGLTGVTVGLQRVYTLGRGSTLYNLITINGLTTNEMFVVNTGNTAEVQLQSGGTAVDGNHTMLATFWTTCNKAVYDADLVISNAKALSDKNYASGLIAYASIFKALSVGAMSQFWEKVPAGTGSNVTFIDRVDGFKKAISTIDDALTALNTDAPSLQVLSNLPSGILTTPLSAASGNTDLKNTLNALKARYSLYAGLYPQALAAANAVDITKKSTFNFDAVSLNPVFETATSTNNVVQVKDSTLGLIPALAPSLTDGRVPFYTVINLAAAPKFRINGFFNAVGTAIPVYLPGEMTLIKAECYARNNDSTSAKPLLASVITKTAAGDPFGVGGNQPAPAFYGSYAALLDEIYRQRCIELYMSGQKLEDMRRFNRPTSERKRNLMPYPLRERDNNPNTPADPPF